MTNDQQWLSRRYLFYRFFSNLWFVEAIWLYFYRLFITDQQVGILDAAAFAIGLVAEVPSGALADKFGRARMTKIGQVLVGMGMFIQAFGGGFVPLFTGQSIMMIGVAFVSGADEALFFEKLNFKRSSTQWRKLVTRGSQMALIASLLAAVAGGLLYTINPHAPWLLAAASFFIATGIIWKITEPRPERQKKTIAGEVGDYLHDIRTGFKEFRLPKLWLYVPLILTVQAVFYATGWGLLRLVLLDRFEFDPFLGSIIIAACSLVTVGILAYMHKYAHRLREKQVLSAIALSAAASLLLAVADIGMWGFVVILALYAGDHVMQPFMSEVLNNRAPKKQRATVLSVASFLRTLPYVALAPIIGFLNTQGQLEYFLVVWAVLIVIAIVLYVLLKKQDAWVDFKVEEASE